MEPIIVEKAAMVLVGMAGYGDPASGAFAKAWDRIGPHLESIPNRVAARGTGTWDAYGIELYPPEFPGTKEWTYLACVEVDSLADVPMPMLVKPIPAATYAVFDVRGGLPALGPTFHRAYHEWLPRSKYEIAAHYDIEHYDERFERIAQDQELEIWIPVKPRT